MDPQHRLFLECSWEALENAGYGSETYRGLTGVFSGVNMSTYLLNNLYSYRDSAETGGQLQTLFGNDKDYVSTRISYKLNLKGPSLSVQTACSTSLVAVHLACQSLLNYILLYQLFWVYHQLPLSLLIHPITLEIAANIIHPLDCRNY